MTIHPAGIDAELVIWLVVVGFTLISQMARAIRQRPRQGRPQAPDANAPRPPTPLRTAQRTSTPPRPARLPSTVTDAQKELEDFLAQLAGQPPPNRQPTPPEREEEDADFEPVIVNIPPPPPKPRPQPQRSLPRTLPERPAPRPHAPRMVVKRIEAPAPVPSMAPRAPVMTPASPELLDVFATASDDPYARLGTAESVSQKHREMHAVLRQDLANLPTLRKAIVLREILDAPLALRQSRPQGI